MFGLGKKQVRPAEFRVPLGAKVRHKITGMEGIATARIQYLTGCNQVAIQPQGLDDKKQPYQSCYFDEPFVEILDQTNLITPVVPRGVDDGCDMAPPSARR